MNKQVDGKMFNFTKLKQLSGTIVICQIAKFFFVNCTTKTGKEVILHMDGSLKL